MDCKECKEIRSEAIYHEGEAMRQQKTIGWLIAVIVLLVVLLFGSNLGWMVYEMQYEDVVTETETQTVNQDAENGENTFIGGDFIGETNSGDN